MIARALVVVTYIHKHWDIKKYAVDTKLTKLCERTLHKKKECSVSDLATQPPIAKCEWNLASEIESEWN